jgi:hypothetical protein
VVRGELGSKVPPALLRVAHPGDELGKHIVVETGRRDDDTLVRESR